MDGIGKKSHYRSPEPIANQKPFLFTKEDFTLLKTRDTATFICHMTVRHGIPYGSREIPAPALTTRILTNGSLTKTIFMLASGQVKS